MILKTEDKRLYRDGKPISGQELKETLKKMKIVEDHENEVFEKSQKTNNYVETKEQRKIKALEAQVEKQKKENLAIKEENKAFRDEMRKEFASLKKGK